jgi:hypothetical protein
VLARGRNLQQQQLTEQFGGSSGQTPCLGSQAHANTSTRIKVRALTGPGPADIRNLHGGSKKLLRTTEQHARFRGARPGTRPTIAGERHASPRGRLSLQFESGDLASGRAVPRSGLRAQGLDLVPREGIPWRRLVSERSGVGKCGRRLPCPATPRSITMSSPRRFSIHVISHLSRKKSNQLYKSARVDRILACCSLGCGLDMSPTDRPRNAPALGERVGRQWSCRVPSTRSFSPSTKLPSGALFPIRRDRQGR